MTKKFLERIIRPCTSKTYTLEHGPGALKQGKYSGKHTDKQARDTKTNTRGYTYKHAGIHRQTNGDTQTNTRGYTDKHSDRQTCGNIL